MAKKAKTKTQTRDIVFSFDTTGSMRSAIAEVRRGVVATVERLFKDIEFLRIGIVAHGDFVDGQDKMQTLPLTNDQNKIVRFVQSAKNTSGGDSPEFYETVLRHVQDLNWQADERALVMIGDATPHIKGRKTSDGFYTDYDWEFEAKVLGKNGIKIYPVQALYSRSSEFFWQGLADISGTPKINLEAFNDMPDILMALTYQNAGQLADFQRQVDSGERKVSRSVRTTLAMLAGDPSKLSKRSARTGERYEVFDVPRDISIQGFVELQGLEFEKGRGFYEWMKSEIVQDYKQVIAQNKATGAIITGERARSVLDIEIKSGRQKPTSETHRGFIQSTSTNRKLIAGTKFLYEVRKDEAVLV